LLALVVLCVSLLVTGCGRNDSSVVDEAPAVVAAYDTYKTAALANDGDAARAALTDTAAVLYDDMREHALTGKVETVNALPMSERILVYAIRADFEADELRAMTGVDMLQAAIDWGIAGDNVVESLSLGGVQVSNDTATAKIVWQNEVSPFRVEFVRQGGVWKFDLTSMMDMADAIYTMSASKQGTTVSAMADTVMETKYGVAEFAELRRPLEG
jgi:hypothetical protein